MLRRIFFGVMLEAYQDDRWIMIAEVEAIGSYEVPLKHPGDFGPPRFRLSIIECFGCYGDGNGRTEVDSWVLNIPYADMTCSAPPEIEFFTTDAESIKRDVLGYMNQNPFFSWEIKYRIPLSNLVLEQVFSDGTTFRNCYAHYAPWRPSRGIWQCPILQPRNRTKNEVRLRLRVFDVNTNEIFDEAEIILPVIGEWPTPRPTPTGPLPTLSPG